jgi:hypothetical protein
MRASINQMDMMVQATGTILAKNKNPHPCLKNQAGMGMIKHYGFYSDAMDSDLPEVAITKPMYIRIAPTNSLR